MAKSELPGTQASCTADFQSAIIITFKEVSIDCLPSVRELKIMKLPIPYTKGRQSSNFPINTGMSLGLKFYGHPRHHIWTIPD